VIAAGKTNRETVMSMDFFPTFAKLAGAAIPQDRASDGRDVMPLLKDDSQKIERELHWLYGNSWAVRKGPWKLSGSGDKALILVNLEQDVEEKMNHLDDQSALVDEFMKLHRTWIESVGTR
jgi:arylsulfatase A-like enzyme